MGSEAMEEDTKPAEGHESPPAKAAEEEESTPVKRGTKRDLPEKGEGKEEAGEGRRRRRSSSAAAEGTPAERPSRERKTVDRYSAVSPRKLSATKSLSIKEGSGTKLKDIPNVVFKLSKRKIDDNLQALHTLLFGRKSNVHSLKRNLFQFSGFVWPENEEKLRSRLKERLDKYNKDKLVDFCELLDVHILKTSTKKEEISAKLLEFLESPYITRDVILADQDKKSKKQRRKTKGETSSNRGTKKQMKNSDTEVKKRRRPSKDDEEEQEDGDEGGSTGTKDASSGEEGNSDSEEEREHVNSEDEDNKDAAEKPVGSKKGETENEDGSAEPKIKESTSPIKKGSPAKSDKTLTKTASKKAFVPAEDETEVAVDSKHSSKEHARKVSKPVSEETAASVIKEDKKKAQRKGSSVGVNDSIPSPSSKPRKGEIKKAKSNEKPVLQVKKPSKKKETKPRSKDTNKEQGEGMASAGPSSEELHSVINNILKEVDFNTATLADILKQLGAHFKMNLMDRKAEVKEIIEDIINSMTEDEDEDTLGDDKEEENPEEEKSDGDGK